MPRTPEQERKHQHYLANRSTYIARARARELADPEGTRERKRIGAKRRYHKQPEKHRAYHRNYREKNPEKTALTKKRARLKNPAKRVQENKRRRASKYNAPINDFTHAQWVMLQEVYDHRCAYCGRRAKGHLTQDHIVPFAKGGSNTLSNIVPSCRHCNTKKGIKPPAVPVQPLLLTLAQARPHTKRRAS